MKDGSGRKGSAAGSGSPGNGVVEMADKSAMRSGLNDAGVYFLEKERRAARRKKPNAYLVVDLKKERERKGKLP